MHSYVMDDVRDDAFSMRLTLATSSDRGNGVLDSEHTLREETSNVDTIPRTHLSLLWIKKDVYIQGIGREDVC